MTHGRTRDRPLEEVREASDPVAYLEELERAWTSSRQWREVMLSFRRF